MTNTITIEANATFQQRWGAILTLMLATFSVVTTEMIPIGLLTPIVEDFSVSLATTGFLMTLPAITAAISSPLIVLFTRSVDRKTLLLIGALLLTLCNLVAALTPYYWLLLISRLFVGVCIGIIWALAGGLVPRLVAAPAVALATSLVFGGVAAASVLGVPFGVLMGEWLGWRAAFASMSFISLLLFLSLLMQLPALPAMVSPTFKTFITEIKRPIIMNGLLITLLIVSGHFMAFTYIRALLSNNDLISVDLLGGLLLIYGLAGIVGNFLFGLTANKHLNFAVVMIASGLILSLGAYIFFPLSVWMALSIMVLWGIAYGGVSVTLMTWMMRYSAHNIEATSSLYIAFFNSGIALGSALGGIFVSLYGLVGNLHVAVLSFVAALALLGINYYQKKAR
ncbi:putative MFS family arabinose efflux permease [Providencia alcalifaciens]|uniref:Putative MFS family arabinose efflux permease n=1 Tax=Providencia alcalifaciens TaxID=126385 RepID=A0A4R3NL46_9GAMM|nr:MULTISPECIES: MFS transporter [Providencia]MBC5790428.1 MFS transporter [Providencia sp. JUb39]TCT35714.1 putative MFS family arabinose efflux permease [Providencia alcalifaciens]